MDTARNITLVAWRRELGIVRTGRGYTVSLRNIGMQPRLALAIGHTLAIAADTDHAGQHQHTLTVNSDQPGSSLARFDITHDEALRLADWAGLDMPRPLALQATS